MMHESHFGTLVNIKAYSYKFDKFIIAEAVEQNNVNQLQQLLDLQSVHKYKELTKVCDFNTADLYIV